jgi:hypothetical protein
LRQFQIILSKNEKSSQKRLQQHARDDPANVHKGCENSFQTKTQKHKGKKNQKIE